MFCTCFQHKELAYSLKLKSSGKPIVANLLSEKSYSQQDRKSQKIHKEVEDFKVIFWQWLTNFWLLILGCGKYREQKTEI